MLETCPRTWPTMVAMKRRPLITSISVLVSPSISPSTFSVTQAGITSKNAHRIVLISFLKLNVRQRLIAHIALKTNRTKRQKRGSSLTAVYAP